jgi:hypothetical protein
VPEITDQCSGPVRGFPATAPRSRHGGIWKKYTAPSRLPQKIDETAAVVPSNAIVHPK